MAHLRNNARSSVKLAVHKIIRENLEEEGLISEHVKRQKHLDHISSIEHLLATAPALGESARLYWGFWLEEIRKRPPKFHLSEKVFSQLCKISRFQNLVRQGVITDPQPEPPGTLERTKAFIASWRARIEQSGMTKDRNFAPFLRDPSLLPKKPPTRKIEDDGDE